MKRSRVIARGVGAIGAMLLSAAASAGLINDGGFEKGPPSASAWTEVANTSCEWISNWSSNWGIAAKEGTYSYWAGGYCGGTPSTSSVSQSLVAISATEPWLKFWFVAYRTDDDDEDLDTAYVSVDGTLVWTRDLTQANDTYPNWTEAVVDLGAYAGQSVVLKFGADSAGELTGNILFDAIGLYADRGDNGGGGDNGSSVPEPATLALLGMGLAGLGALRRRRA